MQHTTQRAAGSVTDINPALEHEPATLTQRGRMLPILAALMAFTSLSTDIYLPAMPQMRRDLHGNIDLTITGFLIGFALAQLIWGPVSDRVGRRWPLAIGMVLFVAGSVGSALSHNLDQIVLWRMFQAVGACTGPMLARAMVRDLYPRTLAAHTLSTLAVIMAVAPIGGPLLGGQIMRFGSWRDIFWLLAALGALMLVALRQLPETLPQASRTTTPANSVFADYLFLLRNANFMRYALCVTLFYVSAYAFVTGSPQVYIEYLHIDTQHYGWLFGINIFGMMVVSLANRQLVGRLSLDVLLRAATVIAAAALLVGVALVELHLGGLPGLMVPVFIYFSMNGIVAASATAAALDGVPQQLVGSAAALLGSLQYGSGIVSSLLLAALGGGTPRSLVQVMAVFAIASAAMALSRHRGTQRKSQAERSDT
ncbi:multidrug effflux MFS transporter [Burkholderia sp. WSM2230]|uniref:multidrug effflux MFS transporter n=1 Tax=Burkholderia sp. WSM2230 TaxID=944435 RepID=UPI0004158174|nr:multidrug effflux MFS transporter [Burkholderia sp. WSM2230]